ncbi:MAG: nitrous oxide-stimulated promoter family protein [Erysipelotrichales bacterium]|nr:nitrous oxide-stimulated promoter family protein [Erysipelotrichales bacterium]
MDVVEKKRNKEKELITEMISMYCKGEHQGKELCPRCEALLQYAYKRLDLCPFMATKTFCSKCKVHCYRDEYREQIKAVMRYSGPRLIFTHPILLLKHTLGK